ncbi:hypothetical protein AY600_15215 [Phormidium willei BDU 130791]|nr:hypothetical protein AY600_15215 [Phormidium willei BDU 130791]
MSGLSAHVLDQRGLLQVSGPDVRGFLQGIVSNDVEKATPRHALWAAFLTPQGKYLHDFLIVELASDRTEVAEDAETGAEGRAEEGGAALLLDCEAARRADLLKRLKLYKLRSKVTLADRSEALASVAIWGAGAPAAAGLPAEPGAARPFHGGSLLVDPRRVELGLRALIPRAALEPALAELGAAPAELAAWEHARIAAGVPDGSRDLQIEKAILLENGFDELGGVDWNKGCYMGQELTARTKYRGLVKKRLVPVEIAGPLPAPGTPVTTADGKAVGETRSAAGDTALALIRLDALDAELTADGAKLTPHKPDWASF